ncbi:HI1506-related protein [Cognaticolwellia mytili]|uniref:HI1506-related protein n=1 Tax=Cognaticolwellia mytili TaxID=1888913 RepID=UPI000A16E5FE|nr:HI1506-related protein [Cognaticolwellia mytili]
MSSEHKKTLIACLVISAMHNGYRRAGFCLNQGENYLPEVDEDQFSMLDGDKNLTVNVVEEDIDISTQDKSTSIVPEGEKVEMNFAWAGEELAPFITAIHKLHCETPLTKKPNVDELVVDVLTQPEGEDGESSAEVLPVKTKPTGAQRDAAWQYYLDNVINHTPG